MPTTTTTFSITVGPLAAWYPEWNAPGVIKEIPNSSFQQGISENGWSAPPDPAAGGTDWPEGLLSYSGGTVAYLNNQPYFCISGGGHATTSDNSIYAFGPLFGDGANAPSWSRLSTLTADGDIRQCSQHYADGRPSSRHTVGDFEFGVGTDGRARIVMCWNNAGYCGNGGASDGTDVFDLDTLEWDNAQGNPHPRSGLDVVQIHMPSAYSPYTRLWYARSIGGLSNGFASYDPASKRWTNISWSGLGMSYDTQMINMGNRPYLYFGKGAGGAWGRINTETGVSQAWGNNPPGNLASGAIAYDSVQDRIYAPNGGATGTNESPPFGTKEVAWLDAAANTNPTWQYETFNGDTPRRQQYGTWGRWSFVPELRGFVLMNTIDTSLWFYRTAE